MPDYNNGKIYIIKCNITGETYYGSTTKNLSERLANHISKPICKSKQIIDRGDYDIILIKNYPCETRKELVREEGVFIKSNECVNKQVAGRTRKEYRDENKEQIQEYMKEWRGENKEKIAEQRKKYREDNKEKIKKYYNENKEKIAERDKKYYNEKKEKIKKYYNENKEKIAEYHKNYYNENKRNITERLKEQQKEKITCDCGCIVSRLGLARHKKTLKHQNFINNN